MADNATSLPIRTEADGTDERLHAKLVDYTDPSGTNKQGQISDNNVHVYDHGKDPGGTKRLVRVSEQGHTSANGVYDAVNNTDPTNVGLIAHSQNATPGDTQQNMRLTAKSNSAGSVRALDVAIRAADGEPFSAGNPLPVFVTGSQGGDEVLDFKQAVAIAKGASDTHNYTVTATKNLTLQKVQASASGKMKCEILLGTTGSEVLKVVLFNSTANPNVEYIFAIPQVMPDTMSVKVKLTNLDNLAQDLYSTIEGVEN